MKKLTTVSQSIMALGIAASFAMGCTNGMAAVDTESTSTELRNTGCNYDDDIDQNYRVTTIDPECTDNPRPRRCTAMVTALRGQFKQVHDHFNNFNSSTPDWFATIYDDQAVLHAQGAFWRGKEQIRGLFQGLSQVASSADLDFSTNHYSVIDNKHIVSYGNVSGMIHLLDGTSVPQSALPESHSWICNKDASDPPFRILVQHE